MRRCILDVVQHDLTIEKPCTARVGLDNVKGFLQGGFDAWKNANKKTDLIIDVEADELKMDLQFDEDKTAVIDVRKPSEFEGGHIDVAQNFSLADLEKNLGELPEHKNMYVHCAGGYRSVIAASMMKKAGYHNLRNVIGGWGTITKVPEMPIVLPVPKEAQLN
jgi:rhodanese-related sulfurtransferase